MKYALLKANVRKLVLATSRNMTHKTSLLGNVEQRASIIYPTIIYAIASTILGVAAAYRCTGVKSGIVWNTPK